MLFLCFSCKSTKNLYYTYYFIDNEQYFNRSSVYGQDDDGERFAFFSKAALEILPHIDYQPDIINANDWHTALSVIYLDDYKSRGMELSKHEISHFDS